MEKNKKRMMKRMLGVAALCIIVGAIVFGIGLTQGGSLRYLSVTSDTVPWIPFKSGFGVRFGNIQHHQTKNTFDDIKAVQVDGDYADVNFCKGNENSITFSTKSGEDAVHYRNDNGILKIRIAHKEKDQVSSSTIKVEVTHPLTYIRVNTSAGDLRIKEVEADRIDAKLMLGDITMTDIISNHTGIHGQCGDISVKGKLFHDTSITNKLGNTNVELKGNPNDYYYHIINQLGDSKIMNKAYEGRVDMKNGSQNMNNQVQLQNDTGDINFDIH